MTATRPRVVRERIDPRLTSSLFANYRSAGDALLELVDNAVDARIPGQPLDVAVALRPGSLTLTATGGRGMSPRQLERDYLRWGASPKRGGELIGRFGQGGKAAIGHLGNRFRIVASPAGDERAYTFRDDAYRDRTRLRTYELQDLAKPVAAGLGYVRIEVGEVDKRLDPARVRIRLAEVYRPLLLAGELVLKVDRSPVQPLPWPVVEQHAISVRAGGRTVRGWWGLLTEPQPPGLVPGFRVYHMGRLIGEPVWFGHVGPGMHPALGRLVGEVEIPHVPVTMNKSDVDRDSPEWAAVEHRLHRLLAPVVRRLTSQQGPGASPQQARTAQQVRRILARALRMVESSALFESRDAGGADGPKEQLTFDQLSPEGPDHPPAASVEPHAPEDASTSERDPPQDGAAPPPGPRGTRRAGTRRGFGDVTIRALDPRVRSALIEEEGVRTVVINSRYPLFDVRKGDLWYQLETALREVCVTIPEATVPEFERRVNELMLVSLALTQRSRRPRRIRAISATRGAWTRCSGSPS